MMNQPLAETLRDTMLQNIILSWNPGRGKNQVDQNFKNRVSRKQACFSEELGRGVLP